LVTCLASNASASNADYGNGHGFELTAAPSLRGTVIKTSSPFYVLQLSGLFVALFVKKA